MKRMLSVAPWFAAVALLGAAPVVAQDSPYLSSNLFGEQIPEGAGTKGASGDFNGEADAARGRLCYYLEIYDLDGADGAAIHEGEQGKSGPALLPLPLPKDRNDEVCIDVDKTLLQSLMAAPKGYYVAVNDPDHPEGAMRGQLN
jgi:hypothetical protein